jgi:hypothetical protein
MNICKTGGRGTPITEFRESENRDSNQMSGTRQAMQSGTYFKRP